MLIKDTNFKLCVKQLQEGRCVLFLGPQFALEKGEGKVHELIKQKLREHKNFQKRLDFNYDNLFLFKQLRTEDGERVRLSKRGKMNLTMQLQSLYNSFTPHEIYQTIPFIPFSAIISCSPDRYLKNAFESQNLEVDFRYYDKKGEGNQGTEVGRNVPILYNIFGDIENEESLIITYESFFKFFISIIGDEQKLPLELTNRLKEAQFFVFMGFDLTKWYIPLLIHKLNSFKEELDTATLVNSDNKYDGETEKFYPVEMLFLNGETVETIESLKEALKDCLREPKKQTGTVTKETIKELIRDNKLKEALEALKNIFEQSGQSDNDIIVLQNRFEELKNQSRLNLISSEEASRGNARIVKAILDLLDLIE